MVAKNAFRELAIQLSNKQPELVDWLLEETPALSLMPFFPTSDGMNHNYEVLEDVTGNGMVDGDSELPSVDARTALESTTLKILGGKMEVGEDKARQMGSAGAVFNSRLPHVLKKTGNSTETSLIYNSFRASAIKTRSDDELKDAAQHAIDAGGSGSTNYSIVIAKFEQGNLSGLYDPNGFGRGMLFDMQAINGGELYYLQDYPGVLGYGMRLKSYFGVLTANPRNTSTIVNIDLTDDGGEFTAFPTAMQIDDALDAVRAAVGGNTVIYSHPRVISALRNTFKLDRLQLQTEDRNFDTQIDAWNGIPLIGTYNMASGDEPAVTL